MGYLLREHCYTGMTAQSLIPSLVLHPMVTTFFSFSKHEGIYLKICNETCLCNPDIVFVFAIGSSLASIGMRLQGPTIYVA